MISSCIEITAFSKIGGPLTKRIRLYGSGKIMSDGSACIMGCGIACRIRLGNIHAFADLIGRLGSHEAIALGALRLNLPDRVEVATKHKFDQINGTARPDLIARTSEHITYLPDRPALVLLDHDSKGMSDAVAARLNELDGFWPALLSIIPELKSAAHVWRRSTSAGLYRIDTAEKLAGSNGLHVYLLVKNGADSERFLKTLHTRCWLAGLGWMMLGAGGQLLERSIVDRMVGAPERLVFEGRTADPRAATRTGPGEAPPRRMRRQCPRYHRRLPTAHDRRNGEIPGAVGPGSTAARARDHKGA